jgi:methylenetetrahydrofolate dehydrogenase (NADP+)/methenyltetrahydrofolate cyclohydrolase
MAKVFQGKKLSRELEREIKKKARPWGKKFGLVPKLASLVVGGNQASCLYLALQEKAAARAGVLFEKKVFPVDADPKAVSQYLDQLNKDQKVHGIAVQLPLPKQLDPFRLMSRLDPGKDVDCLTPKNLGLLLLGQPVFLPAVVKAVLLILKSEKIRLKGKNVVLVGAGNLVGKPLAVQLKNLGATVVLCDEETKNLGQWTKKGEILIAAAGIPGLIKKEMVRAGALVIDAGSPRPEVDFEKVKEIASLITPVPGGLGPLTVACLLENTLESAASHLPGGTD